MQKVLEQKRRNYRGVWGPQCAARRLLAPHEALHLRFMVQGVGFGVQGLGFWDWGFGDQG